MYLCLNQVLRRAQLYTTAEVEPWTVGASMDKTFKRDTALNLDCDQIFDITWFFFTQNKCQDFTNQLKISSSNFLNLKLNSWHSIGFWHRMNVVYYNELKNFFAFEQFIMLLNINPVKKMFEEIFNWFVKSRHLFCVKKTHVMSKIWSQSKFRAVSCLNVLSILAPTVQGSTSAVV